MHFEKTMCDRLGYKYKDIFSHLEFILNKMNNLLNNYGCGLSDKELEMLSQLFLKLETGKIEIIEFTKPIEKYLDVDEIYKENQELKEKIETYENPEDLTLMFMYCDEKAKDKIKELKKQLEVGEEQYNDLAEEKENLQEQLSIKNLQLEEMKLQKRDYTQENILEMKLTLKENQQKEFIEYLENCINELKKESMNKLQNTINLGIVDITKEILSKYKKIIGEKDER